MADRDTRGASAAHARARGQGSDDDAGLTAEPTAPAATVSRVLMGAISYLRDRLTNVMSGMGTTADRRTAAFYNFVPLTGEQAEAGYRSSWLVRKIVDVPPLDMTREWRDWQADARHREARGRGEAAAAQGQVPARAGPGAALRRRRLILGTATRPDAAAQPGACQQGRPHLRPRPVARHQLSEGQQRLDPPIRGSGSPDYFTINGANGAAGQAPPVARHSVHRPEGA
jgi:hypothetical protein